MGVFEAVYKSNYSHYENNFNKKCFPAQSPQLIFISQFKENFNFIFLSVSPSFPELAKNINHKHDD